MSQGINSSKYNSLKRTFRYLFLFYFIPKQPLSPPCTACTDIMTATVSLLLSYPSSFPFYFSLHDIFYEAVKSYNSQLYFLSSVQFPIKLNSNQSLIPAPEQAPSSVECTAVSPTSLRVGWQPIVLPGQGSSLVGYTLLYATEGKFLMRSYLSLIMKTL